MPDALQVIRTYDDVASIRDNVVHLRPTPGSEMTRSSITFAGTGNVLHVEDGTMLRGTRLRFMGNDSVIHIRRSTRTTQVVATVYADSVLYLGPGASFTSEARFLPTERKHVIIGSDAMFSSRVVFRTADPHLVYSTKTGARVNPSASIWIGDHVWLGEDSLFLKGSRVGSGSIVAARAVVTKAIPSNSTGAGVPAKVIGQDIFWTRPSVHAWTREQTDAAQVQAGDRFTYASDEHVLDVAALEADLESRVSGVGRAQWCHGLDALTAKNRFHLA